MTQQSSSLDAAATWAGTEHITRATAILERLFAGCEPRDFAIRLWDGQTLPAGTGGPLFTLVINHPATLRCMFLPPTELNLGEAYIFGDFDIEGDIIAATGLADYFFNLTLPLPETLRLAADLLRLPARAPRAESTRPGLRPSGRSHSRRRDRTVVQYHYDVSNDFYQCWLDESLTYSCAYFITGEEDIHTAQRQKLAHICRKLRLQPGERLLDIGCGWGSLILYAAQHYGVEAVGITLSEQQVAFVQQRIAEAGLEGRCRVELLDYRDVPEDDPFDKLVSVGMFEHVGLAKMLLYFQKAWALLRPGGLFLNHGIASQRAHQPAAGGLMGRFFERSRFVERYVFPDGELVDINQALAAAESAGFEVRDVESLREHYALTLRHWVTRLEAAHDRVLRHVDEPTYRVWRLHMAGCAHGFARSRTSVFQALLSKGDSLGRSHLPWSRADLYQD